MTTKKDEPGKDVRPGDNAQQKRPYATIELKATEIKQPEAPKPAAAASAATAAAKPAEPVKPAAAAGASATSVPPAAKAADGKPAEAKPSETKAAASGSKPADAQKIAETKATAAPPKVAANNTSGGGFGRFMSHLAAGIAGGFLALTGAQTIGPKLGISPDTTLLSEASSALDRRLAALEQTKASPAAASPELAQKLATAEARFAKLDEMQKSLAALGAEQAQLATQTKAVSAKLSEQAAPDGAAARLGKLEERLALMAAGAENDPQKGRVPQLAAITGRIADLETTMTNQLTALRKGVAEQVEARVGLIAEASEAAKSGTGRIDRELSGLKTETAKLGQRLEAIKADGDRLGEKLRIAQEETGGLKSGFEALKGDLDTRVKALAKPADVAAAVTPLAGKLTSLEQNVQGLAKSEEDRRTNAERIVLSLELANLKRILDRGLKYAPELAEVKKAAGGKIDLAALEKFKDQGVPTVADLQRDFRPVIHAMIDADSEAADASVIDRLISGAKNVVRVRKVSTSADDKSVEATAARMETALKDGRLGDVVSDAKSLTGRAAAAAKDWLGKVEARASVDKALADIEKQLKTSLAAAPAAADKATK